MGAWLVLRAECELLDGHPITDRDEALLILRRHKAIRPATILDRLLEVRLLDVTDDGGYAIHDREDHDRPRSPSDEAEATRARKAAERARKAARDEEDVTTSHESVTNDVTTSHESRARESRASLANESEPEPAYEGGQDDPEKDPLTVICRLIGYWPKPADHAEYKVAVEEMERRYGIAWTLEAIPQAPCPPHTTR